MGYLTIPSNFSAHLKDRLIFRLHADNETLDGSTVGVRLDMTRKFTNKINLVTQACIYSVQFMYT